MSKWFSLICYVVIELPAKLGRAILDHEFLTKWWYSHYR